MENKYEGAAGIKEAAKYLEMNVTEFSDLLNERKIEYSQKKINNKNVIEINFESLSKFKASLEEKVRENEQPVSPELHEQIKIQTYLGEKLGLYPSDLEALGIEGQKKVYERRKALSEVFYNSHGLADTILKGSKASKHSLITSEDPYFNKYLGLLKQVVLGLADWADTYKRIEKNPFMYASVEELSKIYQRLQCPHSNESAKKEIDGSKFADAETIKQIEEKGFDFKQIELIVERGMGGFIGGRTIQLESIHKNICRDFRYGSAKLEKILKKMIKEGALNYNRAKGVYSFVSDCGTKNPLQRYIRNFINRIV